MREANLSVKVILVGPCQPSPIIFCKSTLGVAVDSSLLRFNRRRWLREKSTAVEKIGREG